MMCYLLFFIVSLFANFGVFCMVFLQLLWLTDMEADHINPFEGTVCINKWILPEIVLQGVLCIVFFFTGHWVLFLMEVPLTCYHVILFMKRKHLIDVTEVFRNLKSEKMYRVIKLGIYMILFSILIFRITLIIFNIIRDGDYA